MPKDKHYCMEYYVTRMSDVTHILYPEFCSVSDKQREECRSARFSRVLAPPGTWPEGNSMQTNGHMKRAEHSASERDGAAPA